MDLTTDGPAEKMRKFLEELVPEIEKQEEDTKKFKVCQHQKLHIGVWSKMSESKIDKILVFPVGLKKFIICFSGLYVLIVFLMKKNPTTHIWVQFYIVLNF